MKNKISIDDFLQKAFRKNSISPLNPDDLWTQFELRLAAQTEPNQSAFSSNPIFSGKFWIVTFAVVAFLGWLFFSQNTAKTDVFVEKMSISAQKIQKSVEQSVSASQNLKNENLNFSQNLATNFHFEIQDSPKTTDDFFSKTPISNSKKIVVEKSSPKKKLTNRAFQNETASVDFSAILLSKKNETPQISFLKNEKKGSFLNDFESKNDASTIENTVLAQSLVQKTDFLAISNFPKILNDSLFSVKNTTFFNPKFPDYPVNHVGFNRHDLFLRVEFDISGALRNIHSGQERLQVSLGYKYPLKNRWSIVGELGFRQLILPKIQHKSIFHHDLDGTRTTTSYIHQPVKLSGISAQFGMKKRISNKFSLASGFNLNYWLTSIHYYNINSQQLNGGNPVYYIGKRVGTFDYLHRLEAQIFCSPELDFGQHFSAGLIFRQGVTDLSKSKKWTTSNFNSFVFLKYRL